MTPVQQSEPLTRLRGPRLAAWRAFLQAHALLSRRLDDELQAEQAISLAEYDALVQLARAPERRLLWKRSDAADIGQRSELGRSSGAA